MLEEIAWNALDVLNAVDGAELVIVGRDRYLCVWDGRWTVMVYDLFNPSTMPEHIPLGILGPRGIGFVQNAIEDYFIEMDSMNEENDLTSTAIGAIVETE
tara:strand:- start:1430 stop:1729 length:300 start_codon:yes stop_codon:yes gene_type:complete